MQLIDFINKRALELTMQTGMRYIDAKKFAMDTIIGARFFPNELVGEIAEDYKNFMVDYNEFLAKNPKS